MAGLYVALLRGINVSGKHKLPMADLRALFEELGCRSVATYIQSGNVVFEASAKLARQVAAQVPARIEASHGFGVPVVIRTGRELREAVAASPYLAEDCDPTQLHLGFLADKPGKQAVAALDPARSEVDRFQVIGKDVHLHLPGGMARTKLTTDYFDRRLGTTMTVRNWRTVQKLIEMTGAA